MQHMRKREFFGNFGFVCPMFQVIIHEISHSWTGNLVTNRTWEHFWFVVHGFDLFGILERFT